MPKYDFECKKCKCTYEELAPFDKTGKYPDVTCPECGSKSKEKVMSSCAYTFANPVGTDKWTSESQGHDYRFKHNLPKVIKERRDAEIASKMGKQPYKHIDDLNKDNSWGEVK
ncbi:MAG: zinc ribbon domain-containing protein [Neisseriaceae bacterium]|nr:MAG: zinc ribbon domain-containing protein [Neisseriaceae bacterium]